MHKATVALAAFILLLGCNADSPTSPGTVKLSEDMPIEIKVEVEQCLTPTLDIAGTWSGEGRHWVHFGNEVLISTQDTLWIELANDPRPVGDTGTMYYNYTLLSFYTPSDEYDPDEYDPTRPLRERKGKIGVYRGYAGYGVWLFKHTVSYDRHWDEIREKYRHDEAWRWLLSWDNGVVMFDNSLAIEWVSNTSSNADLHKVFDYAYYERVDE